MRLKEALKFKEVVSGKKLLLIDLGRKLFPDAEKKAHLSVYMSNLINGKFRRIDPKWIDVICQETGVDANFLFDIESMDGKESKDEK